MKKWLSQEQVNLIAEKLMDLANFVVLGTLFEQLFLSNFDLPKAFTGAMLWILGYFVSFFLMKKRKATNV